VIRLDQDKLLMAFEFQHFAEHHLILISVSGVVSLQENLEIGLQLQAALEQVETTVDILFDLRSLERFPTSISQLRASSAFIRSAKLGWVLLLTGNKPLLKLVATALIQLQTRTGRIRVFDMSNSLFNFLQETPPFSKDRLVWLSELRAILQ
jgi:hypothetical protein